MRYETDASAEALRAGTHSYDEFLKAKVAIGGPRYRLSEPIPRARVRVQRYSSGTLDPDNLAASCKGLLDVLCRVSTTHPYGLGFIEDDSPDHIELIVTQEKCKRGTGSTIVSIAPMGNE